MDASPYPVLLVALSGIPRRICNSMEVIFMGTGTSQGVPMIAHDNAGLDLHDLRNWRTRSSIHVVMGGHHVQVDAGPEFRLQCLRNDIREIDTFILTHGHADHLVGMDDLRRFCDLKDGAALQVYSTEEGQRRVREAFPYAIGDKPSRPGYPAFLLHDMPPVLELPGGKVYATPLPHGRINVLGLVFEEASTGAKFGYFCDCKEVPAEARALAEDAHAVALDGLRLKPHPSHMTIFEATETALEIGAPASYLTHMTFQINHASWEKELPAGVFLAYDGLRLTL